MSKLLNIGVVGLGEQAWENLLPALILTRRARISAVCDVDQPKLKQVSTIYNASPYIKFQEMLIKEPLDAMVVASSPQVHNDVLKESIARKIPIFVEKPPTLYTSELDDLVKLNIRYKTPTAVGLNFNFADPIKFVREMIQKAEFGNIAYLRISHYGSKPNGTLWGLSSKVRSFLLAQAIHPLGFIYAIGTDSKTPHALRCVKNESGMLFNLNMSMLDTNQRPFATELLTTSMAPFFEWQLHLVSDTGIIVNINSLWEMEVYSRNRRNILIDNHKWWRDTWRPSPLSNGFKRTGYENQFHEFFDNIICNKAGSTTIADMLPIYKVMDKMEEIYEENN